MDMTTLLNKLKSVKAANELLGLNPKEPLSEDLMKFLAIKWLNNRMCNTGELEYTTLDDSIMGLAGFRYDAMACGCMGPQEGEPLCPCGIWVTIDGYKLDIATYILENDLQIEE